LEARPLTGKSLLFIGIATYLISLIIQTPLRQVLAWIEPLPEQIKVYSVEGTIFSAQAELIQKNKLRLEHVSWKFRPEMLFTGRLAGDLTFENSDQTRGVAQINYPIFGSPHLTNTRIRFPVQAIESLLLPMPINLNGWISIELNYLAWLNNHLDIAGDTRLENIVFSGSTPPAPFGDFLIIWETLPPANNDAPIIRGNITDQGGPLQLNAQINLDNSGAWKLSGTIVPRPAIPSQISQMLIFLGQPDSQGKYSISWNGRLPNISELLNI